MRLRRAVGRFLPALLLGIGLLGAGGCGSRDPGILREQGARAYRAGRYEVAVRAFERAAERDPGHGEGWMWLGLALGKVGKTEAALRAFYEAAARLPNDPRPLEHAARVLGRAGRWREARVALNQALQRAGTPAPALLNAIGVAAAMDGRIETARAQFAACGHYPPALYNAAILARDWARDRVEARRLFEAYLQASPEGERAEEARRAIERLGNAGRTAAPSASDSSPPTPPLRAAEMMRQARTALQRRNYEEAAQRFREAADADPRNAEAVWELAQVWDRRLQNPERAMENYRRFLRDFPDDGRAAEARRRLNELSARPSPPRPLPETPPPDTLTASELVFRKPEKRQPDAARAALLRGNEYLARADYDRAIFDYRRAIELDDTLDAAYFNLGLVYWQQKKDALARALFQKALAARPDWPEARYMLALVYQREGLWIKAEEHLRALTQSRPPFADAFAALALHHAQSPAHRAQTRAWFEQYLKLEPNGRYAATARAWLAANP
jgi:tetratricopeptide (TPR) repeat protein